jgi:hypothetical protein
MATQYEVYRNLHNGKISIRDVDRGVVVGHADHVLLHNPEFIVRESGRQRVLRERKKNVHAFIRGSIIDVDGFESYKHRHFCTALHYGEFTPFWVSVTYNPYLYDSFVEKERTGIRVKRALYAEVNSDGSIQADVL